MLHTYHKMSEQMVFGQFPLIQNVLARPEMEARNV